MKTIIKSACIFFSLFIFLMSALPSDVEARQEYADRAGKSCAYCHRNAEGGGLNAVGVAYIKNGYNTPVPF